MTSKQFVEKLKPWQSDKEYEKISRYFDADGKDNQIIGVRMKNIFDLAKENRDMPLDEVENLLESPYYEARMGAVSILDFKVRKKNITKEEHKKLFDLYLDRHDRINNWDYVDRPAERVIGKYLDEYDKPRDILYELAQSDNVWERRTAMSVPPILLKKVSWRIPSRWPKSCWLTTTRWSRKPPQAGFDMPASRINKSCWTFWIGMLQICRELCCIMQRKS